MNKPNPVEVVQRRVNDLLTRFKGEIEAAPLHWGMRFDATQGGIDDGAQYEKPAPEKPAFVKEDLHGWEPIGPSFND